MEEMSSDCSNSNCSLKLTRWRSRKGRVGGKDLVLVGEEGGEAEGLGFGIDFVSL